MRLISAIIPAVALVIDALAGPPSPKVPNATNIPNIDAFLQSLNTTSEAKEASSLAFARVHNNCGYDVSLWSVDRHQDPHEPTMIPAGGWHHEQFRIPCDGCGVAFKISRESVLKCCDGGNHMHFEYGIRDGMVYYDISFVDCADHVTSGGASTKNCPGHEGSIQIRGNDCEGLYCIKNTFCDSQAYYIPEPKKQWDRDDPVKGCPPGSPESTDVFFTLCSDN